MARLSSYEADRLNDAIYGMDDGGKAQERVTARFVRTDPDGTSWVRFEGADKDTPLTSSMSVVAREGDLIDVRLGGYEAVGGGNRTDPSAGFQDVKAVTVEVEHIKGKQAEFEKVTAQELEADKARIGDLEADTAKVHDLTAEQLSAATAYIASLTASSITASSLAADIGKIHTLTAEQLSAAAAYIAALTAGSVTAQNIIADHGDFATVKANAAKVANLTAAQLEADHATVANLDTNYAHADLANVDNAWISSGTIKNGAISSAMINDVSANKLTAGTINGSVINVTNLNADNITAGTINGQRIGAGSLSLDKLSEDVYTEAEVDAMLDSMQSEIDGAIETWTGTDVPTLNNAPASAWTTAADRDKHVGDVYFNTTSGYNYRFTKSGTGSSATYSWLQIKDTDITNALQRIQTAEGKITTFDSDISTLKTDTGELKTKTQSLETSLGDKVDTTTFNELSSTVDENSASITSMSTVLTNNGLTSSTNITNTVNTVSQTASGNSSKISQLTTTLGTNADGTSAANDVMHRVSDVEQDLDGITTRVSKTEAHIAGDFALSTTGASTTAKTATITPAITGWTLEKGVSVTVRFDKENTVASPTLNVNSTGAKAIRDYAGNTLAESAYKWKAGTVYSFTYDGTYWRLQDSLLTSRVTQAESTITQHATDIEAKVSKDGVIAAINLSTEQSGGSAVKISADKVNIEGATIFTSGRLSQSSLDSAYDTAGSASDAFDDAKEYVDGKGYQTASDVSTAITTGTANLAAKADAIARTQRIYYRQMESGAAPGLNQTWLSTSGTGYGNWSLSVPQLTSGTTKYPKLYTAVQTQTVAQQAAGSACSCSPVLLDDSTTVIDGGNIITGSVTANKLEVYDATIQKIRADAIDTASIIVGQDQVDGLDETLDELIPTSMSQLENDSGYVTDGYVPAEIPAAIVKGELQADQIDVNSLRSALLQVANLLIGNTDEAHIVANGDRMSFMAGGHEVAYVQVDNEGGTFYMTRSIVVKDMQFGDGLWKWYKRDNNNMSLKWMGGM